MSYILSQGHNDLERKRLKNISNFMKPFVDRVLRDSALTSGKHCLDVGCGYGDSSMMLGNYVGQTGSVSFLDNDSTTLEIAKKELAMQKQTVYIPLSACDLVNVDYVDSQYDYVFCRNVLIHQTDPIRFINKLYEKIKPGGILCVVECDMNNSSNPHSEVIERYNNVVTSLWHAEGLDPDIGDSLYSYFSTLFKRKNIHTVSTSLKAPNYLNGIANSADCLNGIIDLYSSLLPRLTSRNLSSKAEYDKWYQDLTHMPPIRELILERITGIWAIK